MSDKIRAIMKREEELGFAVTQEYWQRDKEVYGEDERNEGFLEGFIIGFLESLISNYFKGKVEIEVKIKEENKRELFIMLMKLKFDFSKEVEQMIYQASIETMVNIAKNYEQINSEEELKQFINMQR